MDVTFIATTSVFIIFIIISYYLDVIRLSVPLVIIYFIFCFSLLVKNDENNINPLSDKKIYNTEKKLTSSLNNKKDNKNNDQIIGEITAKPIVSFTPKPIIIDSNIIIQKESRKVIINKDSLDVSKIKISEKDKIMNENNNTLKLNEIMICRGIYKRNPIKPGFNFINNVDSLFCYTKISNSGPKQEIKHIWYFEEKEISSVLYNIKTSYNYRSWSKKTIFPHQTGRWRVEVVDYKGNILGKRDFTIKSISDTY